MAAKPTPVAVPAPQQRAATEVQVAASDRVSPAGQRAVADADLARQLRTVDPERIFATAKPGPDVPQLRIEGASERRIAQGASAELAMRTAPNAPVTFASREGGEFPNHQASITVQADATGLATTTFTATPGTVDDVYIQAGSPAAVGTLSIVVHVLYPDSPFVLSQVSQP